MQKQYIFLKTKSESLRWLNSPKQISTKMNHWMTLNQWIVSNMVKKKIRRKRILASSCAIWKEKKKSSFIVIKSLQKCVLPLQDKNYARVMVSNWGLMRDIWHTGREQRAKWTTKGSGCGQDSLEYPDWRARLQVSFTLIIILLLLKVLLYVTYKWKWIHFNNKWILNLLCVYGRWSFWTNGPTFLHALGRGQGVCDGLHLTSHLTKQHEVKHRLDFILYFNRQFWYNFIG